jgi:hypothetical protein
MDFAVLSNLPNSVEKIKSKKLSNEARFLFENFWSHKMLID